MTCLRPLFRMALAGLLVLAAGPLTGQLDPRLQASKTDFLDLYQQSTSAKAKPEVLSIFDCSLSMKTLMFHPLYRNLDKAGVDDSRLISCNLTGAYTGDLFTLYPTCNNRCSSYPGAIGQMLLSTDAAGKVTLYNPSAQDLNTYCGSVTIPQLRLYAAPESVSILSPTTMDFYSDSSTATGHPWWKLSNLYSNSNAGYARMTLSDRTTPTTSSAITLTLADGSSLAQGTYYPPGTALKLTTYMYVAYPTNMTGDLTTTVPSTVTWGWGYSATVGSNYGSSFSGTTTLLATGTEPTDTTKTYKFYRAEATTSIPTWVAPLSGDPVTFAQTWVSKVNGVTVATGPSFLSSAVYSQWKSGDVLTITTGLISYLPSGRTEPISVGRKASSPCSAGTVQPVLKASTLPSSGSITATFEWTIPQPCTPATAPSVQVNLSPYAGATPVPGATYIQPGYGDFSNGKLIKPDGTEVTPADADKAGGYGRNLVANWVTAASHVRFSCLTPGDYKVRTIDIPLPWKVLDPSPTNTSNPLASLKLWDQQDKLGVTHGSRTWIEIASPESISTPIDGIFYTPAYLSWLFNGKYQSSDATKPNYTTDSALAGKYIVFDAADATLAAGQGNVSWGRGFGPAGTWGSIRVPTYNVDGTYAGIAWKEASGFRAPVLTRLQAMKKAAIQSWIAHQADAYWAFRCLDQTKESGVLGTNTTLDNRSYTSPGTAASDWVVLNNTAAQGINATSGNSVKGMAKIASLTATGDTPLTYALARSLAQFGDPSSVFNAVEGTDVSQCGTSCILLITDGQDNNGGCCLNGDASPYFPTVGGATVLDAGAGNRAILADKTTINRTGTSWNLHTLAGVGAHLADPGLGTVNTDYLAAPTPSTFTGTPSQFLPLAIKQRNGISLSRDRRVMTMTMGVGLGGLYTEPSSPKRSLFLAAIAGDPGVTSAPLGGFTPFNPATDWVPDPRDPGSYPTVGKRRDGSVCFFDASDTDTMVTAMDYLFRLASGNSTTQATSSPAVPYVGASLGKEVYLGRFTAPANGGSLWQGDLLMFGLGEANGTVSVLDKDGSVASTLDATTAIWSASAALQAGPVGTARKLFTRIPFGSALKPFTDSGSDFTDATSGLKNFVATGTADLATKQSLIRFVAGGDTTNLDASGRPRTNRASIMGDIISSSPAVAEYAWADVGSKLGAYARLSAVVAAGGNRFRMILVGTNQGWLHAFGEVTRTLSDGRVTGDIQELWSFLPTDFLANLSYFSTSSNAHRFLVDGSPAIYHLDLPPASGGAGNGVIDSTERAVVVFGLRKGGRSYYALDIHDPFNPALRWSLVPDEAASLGSGRVISGGPSLGVVQDLVGKFGFATSTPAFGRIIDPGGVYRDAVFLAGGYSNAETDAQFGTSTKLGRSVLALDAYTGEVLGAVDLLGDPAAGGSAPGSLASGVVPFEFILNSGMAQRAYFLDYAGGLWAWGSKAVSSTAPYLNFRKDSAKVSDWSLRKVYQDDNANFGARFTTPPAPFRVGSFPGKALSGSPVPAAVGVALVSGDRHNPLDQGYGTSNPGPTRHRLTVVFDRQDSRAWGFDSASGADVGMATSNLKDFSANTVSSTPSDPCGDAVLGPISPGCGSYYLAPASQTPSFGYWIGFPAKDATTGFVPKALSPPLVSGGSLFYSWFTPVTFSACTGGTGTSSSWLVADVVNPLVADSRTGRYQTSGQKGTWSGVASDFMAIGTTSVLQAGMREVAAANLAAGTPAVTTLAVSSTATASTQRFAKPRVWRTIH